MRICVLGGSGFIGTNLATILLQQGHEVVIGDIVDSNTHPSLYKHCDVENMEQVRATISGCDVIYNLAAEHKDDVRPIKRYYDVNVIGATVVCKAAELEKVKRIVFTSSVAIYGMVKAELDESGAPNPFNHYGKSKLEAEAEYQKWAASDPTNQLITIRPTVVFGENNRGNFYNLLSQVVTGKFLMIGNGKNSKSVAYVENVASFLAYVLSLEKPADIYNYVDKPDMNMNALICHLTKTIGKKPTVGFRIPYLAGYCGGKILDGISRVSGKSFPISSIRVQKFCSNSCFKAERVRKSGFVAPYSLEEAIVKTIRCEWPELIRD